MILPEYEAKKLLQSAGMPVVMATSVSSPEQAAAAGIRAGYPLVLKFASTKYSHKSDIGGVRLDLKDESELLDAFADLDRLRTQLDPAGEILLEPMVPAGAELFIGVQRHPQFGLILSAGLGGVMLELLRDVAFRLLPAAKADFSEMLGELLTWPKLRAGFRHLPSVDADSVIALLSSVGEFALQRPGLQELDLNPVIAGPSGVMVVDAMMVLAEPGVPGNPAN